MVSSRSTSVFWDTVDCKIPSELNLNCYNSIKSRICASLRGGGVRFDKIEVYAFGFAASTSTKVRKEFDAGDIKLIESGVKKNGADTTLINNMYSWSQDNPKGNILLIAGDSDYIDILKILVKNGHRVMIAGMSDAAALLMDQAQIWWSWPNIVLSVRGSFPMYFQNKGKSEVGFGPINIIIYILQCLRFEHVLPTLENIKEYYDAHVKPSSSKIHIDNALKCACDHNKVISHDTQVPGYGILKLYILFGSYLGFCALPIGGNIIDYVDVWIPMQTFLLDNNDGKKHFEPGKSILSFAGILQKKFFAVNNFHVKFLIGDILAVIHVMLKAKPDGLEWIKNCSTSDQWHPTFMMGNIRSYKDTVHFNSGSAPVCKLKEKRDSLMLSSTSTACFLDAENCKLPSQLNCAKHIKSRIHASLCRGGVRVDQLKVYAFANIANINSKVREELEAGDIKLIDTPSGGGEKENGVDNKLTTTMYKWSQKNREGNIVLIAGDSDYVVALKNMVKEGHRVMIAGRWDAGAPLIDQGLIWWNWPNIVVSEYGSYPIFYRNEVESDSKERLGLINIIIRILQILQFEHVLPTLENIKECYDARAELRSRNINIDDALQCACNHSNVIAQYTQVPSYGILKLYRLFGNYLGFFSPPLCGTIVDYVEVWMPMQTFLLDNNGGGEHFKHAKSIFSFAEILRKKFFDVNNFDVRFLIGDILAVINVMLKPKPGGLEWIKNISNERAPTFMIENIRSYKG